MIALARANGAYDDPVLRERLGRAAVGLHVMRSDVLRTLAENLGGAARDERGQDNIAKLVWAGWHRELAARHGGAGRRRTHHRPGYDLDDEQRLFLFSRADTIYGGSDEIQRTILAERVLGLPREPKGTAR